MTLSRHDDITRNHKGNVLSDSGFVCLKNKQMSPNMCKSYFALRSKKEWAQTPNKKIQTSLFFPIGKNGQPEVTSEKDYGVVLFSL